MVHGQLSGAQRGHARIWYRSLLGRTIGSQACSPLFSRYVQHPEFCLHADAATGGGFSLDGSPDHLDFWGGDVMAHVNKERPDSVAFLFLAYTLVPYATYPTQICEAIEALSYILEQLGKAPSNVSLGGDSAGGNLCIAVLSHLLHPSPDLPSLKTSGPLKLMLLLGPWTSFRMDFPSCESNSDRDITTTRAEIMWSSTYLAESASTPYAEPHSAEPGWWRGAENRVEHIICTAGSDEILVDSITQWVEKYTSVTPKGHLRYVVGHREIHTAPIMRLLFKDSPPTQQGEAIKAFLLARL